MPVNELGPKDVLTVSPDDEVGDVVDGLESEDVGSAVVTEDREPVGIVTDRDVALSVTDGDDVASRSVDEIMTEGPATLHEDEPDMEIARALGEENVRRIPVVDDAGNLTGIVTMDDLVATIGEQLDEVADTIEVQSPDYQP